MKKHIPHSDLFYILPETSDTVDQERRHTLQLFAAVTALGTGLGVHLSTALAVEPVLQQPLPDSLNDTRSLGVGITQPKLARPGVTPAKPVPARPGATQAKPIPATPGAGFAKHDTVPGADFSEHGASPAASQLKGELAPGASQFKVETPVK